MSVGANVTVRFDDEAFPASVVGAVVLTVNGPVVAISVMPVSETEPVFFSWNVAVDVLPTDVSGNATGFGFAVILPNFEVHVSETLCGVMTEFDATLNVAVCVLSSGGVHVTM